MLTEEQRERYSRQLILEGFDERLQQRLLEARVLIVGAGGIGSSALLYLAASGVGSIGIVDHETRANVLTILEPTNRVSW